MIGRKRFVQLIISHYLPLVWSIDSSNLINGNTVHWMPVVGWLIVYHLPLTGQSRTFPKEACKPAKIMTLSPILSISISGVLYSDLENKDSLVTFCAEFKLATIFIDSNFKHLQGIKMQSDSVLFPLSRFLLDHMNCPPTSQVDLCDSRQNSHSFFFYIRSWKWHTLEAAIFLLYHFNLATRKM